MANNVNDYSMARFSKNGTKQEPKPVESKTIQAKTIKAKTPLKTKTQLKAKVPMKKSDKPINKKSKNKEEVTELTYNTVLTRDKQCRLKDKDCKGKLDLHHINGRGKGRTNNVDNCCMLCEHHHNEVVHKENKKYRSILKEMINI